MHLRPAWVRCCSFFPEATQGLASSCSLSEEHECMRLALCPRGVSSTRTCFPDLSFKAHQMLAAPGVGHLSTCEAQI